MEQDLPRLGLALHPGLLRDALAASLASHAFQVVGVCGPDPAALGALLAGRPDVLLLAVDDDGPGASRAQGCLRRAGLAGVPVVTTGSGREAAWLRTAGSAGATAVVGSDEPLEVLVARLRAAADRAAQGADGAGGGADAAVGRGALRGVGRTPVRDLLPAGPPPQSGALVPVLPGRPALSVQEERTLVLYVTGLKLAAVARRLGVRYDTAKGYLDRVRAKYAAAGRPARTKTDLDRVALEDGRLASSSSSAYSAYSASSSSSSSSCDDPLAIRRAR